MSSNDPTWQSDLETLRARQAMAEEMGGPDKVEKQKSRGKLTIRERINGLVDPGSFREIGKIAGRAEYDENGDLKAFMASNFIFGKGEIDARPVVASGDDFTVRGGAGDAAIYGKMIQAELMARDLRMPIVRLVDGTGGGGSVKSLDMDARTYVPMIPGWETVVGNMAQVPVVALALGPCAGLGAVRVATSHYSVMVKGLSQVFVAGPPVVARIGSPVDKEELGGSEIQGRNGVVDDVVASEQEAFERARCFLSYLPSSIDTLAERTTPTDDPQRREEALLSAVPRDRRKVYKMRKIIEAVFDEGSFFEMGRLWGRSVITGFARLDGWPVAVLANDPYHYAGAWTAESAEKIIRFVDLCETFHMPVVHLVDNPGFLVGPQSEQAGVVRKGSRAVAAIYQASVPWATILIRKVYGVAGAANIDPTGFRYRYAWPSGDWGSLPMEGGIEAAFAGDLSKAEDPEALLKDIRERMEKVRSPFRTAEAFLVEDMIDPRDTRPLLCEFANLTAPLRKTGPSRFPMRP